jgi:hypothetical protein
MEKQIEKCSNIKKLSTNIFIASISDSEPKIPTGKAQKGALWPYGAFTPGALGASGCTARSRNRRQAVAGHDSTASWKNWMMGKLDPLIPYIMWVKTMS